MVMTLNLHGLCRLLLAIQCYMYFYSYVSGPDVARMSQLQFFNYNTLLAFYLGKCLCYKTFMYYSFSIKVYEDDKFHKEIRRLNIQEITRVMRSYLYQKEHRGETSWPARDGTGCQADLHQPALWLWSEPEWLLYAGSVTASDSTK